MSQTTDQIKALNYGDIRVPRGPEAGAGLLSMATVVSITAGLLAGWLAAGSMGMIGHALQSVLVWIMLGVAVVVGWPEWGKPMYRWPLLLAAGIAAVLLQQAWLLPANMLGPVVVLALLAIGRQPPARTAYTLAASALGVAAIYRVAYMGSTVVFNLADTISSVLGRVGSLLTGQSLWVGPTYFAMNILVAALALWLMWVLFVPGPRLSRALIALAVIIGGHLLYVAILSCSDALLERLGGPIQEEVQIGQNPPWHWQNTVRTMLPWNLPALAGIIHAIILGFMLRWTDWSGFGEPPSPESAAASSGATNAERKSAAGRIALLVIAIVMAVLLPVLMMSPTGPMKLAGKKVVIYQHGFLNWMKPEHGQYGRLSIGMYGMLPKYIRSFGAQCIVSPELSAADMADADLLIFLFPNKPWKSGQLERVWQFVEQGGSVLVMGEHTIQDEMPESPLDLPSQLHLATRPATQPPDQPIKTRYRAHQIEIGRNRFNEILGQRGNFILADPPPYGTPPSTQPVEMVVSPPEKWGQDSAIRVAFDSATFAIGGWLQSYDPMLHPTNAGLADDRNQFGTVTGASLKIGWPARPLLIGRHGWNDPGDIYGNAMMSNHRYDGGERLGDVLLAAEQRVGKGRLVVFGDTSSLTNGINVGAHEYVGRLFAYLASPAAAPSVMRRDVLGALAAVLLILALLIQPSPLRSGGTAAVLALALLAMQKANIAAFDEYPDYFNLQAQPSRPDPDEGVAETKAAIDSIAYLDCSHLEYPSSESWRPEGTMGLGMTLMRNGYLYLDLRRIDQKHLLTPDGKGVRANLLISAAASRPFTAAEQDVIVKFVENGGVFICTVGYDERHPSAELLEKFGFQIGEIREKENEPLPMGHFKAPFMNIDGQFHFVRFWAGWTVKDLMKDNKPELAEREWSVAMPLAYGRDDSYPIMLRRVKKGKVMVVADTCFVMNKNLENEGGEPFEGLRENADFWRYVITVLWDKPTWLPQPSKPPAGAEAAPQQGGGR